MRASTRMLLGLIMVAVGVLPSANLSELPANAAAALRGGDCTPWGCKQWDCFSAGGQSVVAYQPTMAQDAYGQTEAQGHVYGPEGTCAKWDNCINTTRDCQSQRLSTCSGITHPITIHQCDLLRDDEPRYICYIGEPGGKAPRSQ